MSQPGIRVFAIRNADQDHIYLYGFGVYEGDFIQPTGTLGILGPARSIEQTKEKVRSYLTEAHPNDAIEEDTIAEIAESLLKNPRIKLDNGKTVWGCQCWWGPEEQLEEQYGDREIIFVDIDEDLARAEASEEEDTDG